MTASLFVALVILNVLVVYLLIAARTWVRARGPRIVVCPETRTQVAVSVDVGGAIVSAIREKPDLRLTSCSRWPERQDCDQPCVRQIETDPSGTRPGTIAAHFFCGQRCAICGHGIDLPGSMRLQPGFLHPVTHRIERWTELAPEALPRAIAASLPLCSNCTLTELFRQRFPDPVTDRLPH